MRPTRLPFLLFTMLLIASCAEKRVDIPFDRGQMTASWYGQPYHGRPTASGEIYDMNGRSAAHKTLPFGSKLKVTNEKTGLSTLVLVNDRGPFVAGRDIDLSWGAAKEIGMLSTGPVLVEYLERDERYIKRTRLQPSYLSIGPFTIQIGAFEDRENAERLKAALELKYTNIYMNEKELKGKTLYRVRLGRFEEKKDALKQAREMSEEGYPTMVIKYEESK